MQHLKWSGTFAWLRVSMRVMMVLVVGCAGMFVNDARGQCIEMVLESKMLGTGFGAAVAIQDDWGFVGDGQFHEPAATGFVQCYKRSETTGLWEVAGQLEPSFPDEIKWFGRRLDVSEDVLVVEAASRLNDGPAEVRVFRLDRTVDRWLEEARLPVTVGSSSYTNIGALSVNGNVIAVGPDVYFAQSPDRVIVFRYDPPTHTWSLEDAFVPVDYGDNDRFGTSLDVSGNWIVTTTLHNSSSYDPITGTAHWFNYHEADGNWHEQQRIELPTEWSFFADVAIDGDVSALGLIDWELYGNREAIMYRWNSGMQRWIMEDALPASAGPFPGWWVTSWLDLADGVVAIGDTVDHLGKALTGSVFVYRHDPSEGTWSHGVILMDPDVAKQSAYAMNVATDDGRIIVGSPAYNPSENNPGRAYIYNLSGPDCNANEWCDGAEVGSGMSADENGNGVPDECDVLPGDANGDEAVDLADLVLVINAWGVCVDVEAKTCDADVAPWPMGDGLVGIGDLLLVLGNWSS